MEETEKENKEEKINLDKNTIYFIAIGVAALLVGGLIGSNFFPNTTGAAILPSGGSTIIDTAELSQKVENYINEGPFLAEGFSAEAVLIEDFSDTLYLVNLNILEGEAIAQEAQVYVTKDSRSIIFGQVLDLDEELTEPEPEPEPDTELEKSDKPEVELFVMSYCPYGTQAEKGILPVVELLGDKIDFKIRFVYYAMHGEEEISEQTRQYCIQKEQESKFIDYLSCFLKEGDFEGCLTENNIDMEALNSCVADADSTFNITANLEDTSSWLSGQFPLFDVDKELNEEYVVGGSPTLVINGTTVGSGRDPASLLEVICSAFNETPAECSTSLSSETPASGFGYEGSGNPGGTCG